MDAAYWVELLRPLFHGRRVIFAGEVAAAWTKPVETAVHLGADEILVYGAGGTGTGPQPDPELASVVTAEARAPTMIEGMRAAAANVASPPPHVLEALARFDPGRDALVVGSFLGVQPDLDGRPFLAHRRPEWVLLEDKSTIDRFWDRLGVDHPPSATVEATPDALSDAAACLDAGAGTVWSGDTREGFNGGGSHVRRVRSAADAADAASFFGRHCDAVRVAPFVEGIPCSIHGIVVDDDVLALRPVEMLTLRRAGTSFFYAGCATCWDPPAADRDAMRALARRVGRVLADEVGFRGAFTVDGIMAADGFLPTELNPRQGAGLRALTAGLDGLSVGLLLDAIVAGRPFDWRARELEELLVSTADETRSAATWAQTPTEVTSVTRRPLAADGDGFRWATDGDDAVAEVSCGASPIGGFARFTVEPREVTAGDSLAPVAVALWSFADQELGTAVGRLSPATAVR